MARIQVLELPGEGSPFALVIDRAGEEYDDIASTEGVREGTGAKFVFLCRETLDVVTAAGGAA